MNFGSEDQTIRITTQTLGKSTEGGGRHLLLQKINFLGLKVKRRAIIEDNELFIYKSNKAVLPSKRIRLNDIQISFPAEPKSQETFKPSKHSIKMFQNNKFTYWLYPADYENYLLLKAQIDQLKNKDDERKIGSRNRQQDVIDFKSQPLINSKTHSREEVVSPDRHDRIDSDDNFHEEDLVEGSDLESMVSYNMSFYASSRVKRKGTLEGKYRYQVRKTKQGILTTNAPTHDDLSEGNRNSLVPQSNFNISDLKTKRLLARNSIDHSRLFELNKSDRRLAVPPKKGKFTRSATAFAGGGGPRNNNLPRDTLGETMMESTFGKADYFPSIVYQAEDFSILSKPVDQYDSFGPHLMGRGSPLEDILHDEEENLIVRTLSHAREMLEVEEDQKVIERMQSKKDQLVARNSTLLDKRPEIGSLKYGLSREIRSYYGESNIEDNQYSRIESKKSRMLSFQPERSPIEEAFELLHNFELEEAKELFLTLSKGNPRLKLFAIECDLIVLSLNGFKDLVDRCLHDLSQLTTELMQTSSSLKGNTNSYFENEITKAECIVFKGILNVVLNHKWQAFLCISESWRIIKRQESQLQNPKIQAELNTEVTNRILFGVGAFNLAFSLVPPTLRKILKIVGITPNKEIGLQHLQKCWETKFSRSIYAALLISCYHLEFELDSQKACEAIEKAMIQFCRFPLFSWVGALLSWRFFQLPDVEILVKNGLEKCANTVQNPIFLTYELGWYYFITGKWEPALDIFLKLISGILKRQFFKNFGQDLQQITKSLRQKGITISLDFGAFPFEEARYALFPHLTHILLNISACYFELKNITESNRWLVAALIANKKYLNYQNKTESDFGHLADKFLRRKSRNMLVFELLYFLKQLVKLPDANLQVVTQQVGGYLKTLQVTANKTLSPRDDQPLVEYLSGTLINTVSYCMTGETALVVSTADSVLSLIELMPPEFNYISQHILYWFGRAAISEENLKMAGVMLKKAIKTKTSEFSYVEKSRKLIQQHNL